MTTFDKLKKGNKVKDLWYGPGKVVRKNTRYCYIELSLIGEVWRYDRPHVNEFITRGKS